MPLYWTIQHMSGMTIQWWLICTKLPYFLIIIYVNMRSKLICLSHTKIKSYLFHIVMLNTKIWSYLLHISNISQRPTFTINLKCMLWQIRLIVHSWIFLHLTFFYCWENHMLPQHSLCQYRLIIVYICFCVHCSIYVHKVTQNHKVEQRSWLGFVEWALLSILGANK
jgi:hypothetical protein